MLDTSAKTNGYFEIISGDKEERDTAEMHGSILRWLSSGELLNVVTTSMSELLEVTDQVKGKEKGTDTLKHICDKFHNTYNL